MGRFDGVLLAADYDDTLMPFGQTTLSGANRAALARFMAAGGRFAIATGRDLVSYRSICGNFESNAPAVLSNGALLYDRGSMLWQAALPADFAADLQVLFDQFPDVGAEVHRGDSIYVLRRNAGILAHLGGVGEAGIDATLAGVPQDCAKIAVVAPVCFEETPLSRAVAAFCAARWPDRYDVALSHGIIDIAAKGVNKGAGVDRLLSHLGLSPAHLYCAGDNWNDVPMLRRAARAFVPASARREMRQLPGVHVVPACRENAIAAVISILARQYL